MPTSEAPDTGELPPFYGEAMVALSKMRGMMTPSEYLVLTFVAERTFRFNKFVELIPVRHFLDGVFEGATNEIVSAPIGLSRRTVETCLRSLIEGGFLLVDRIEARGYDARAKWLAVNTEDKRFKAMLPVRKKDRIEGEKAASGLPQVRQRLRKGPAMVAVQEQHEETHPSSLRSESRTKIGEGDWIEEESPAPIQSPQAPADRVSAAIQAVDQREARPEVLKTKGAAINAALKRLARVSRYRDGFDPIEFTRGKGRHQLGNFLMTSAGGHQGEDQRRQAVDAFEWVISNWDMVSRVHFGFMKNKPLHPTPALFGTAAVGSMMFGAYLRRDRTAAEFRRLDSGVETQIARFMKQGMTREDAEVRAEANVTNARQQSAQHLARLQKPTADRRDLRPVTYKRDLVERRESLLDESDVISIDLSDLPALPAWEDD